MPDGNTQIRTARADAQWYNLQQPKYDIESTPKQPIATGTVPTVFGIKGTNFDVESTDMTIYKITWQIKPELPEKAITISDDGQLFTVAAGNWPENSSYVISAELIFIEQPSINNTESMKFNIYCPPKNGSITMDPPHGYFVETTFRVSVANYTDPISDWIKYNVYESFDDDTDELKKGPQLNKKALTLK